MTAIIMYKPISIAARALLFASSPPMTDPKDQFQTATWSRNSVSAILNFAGNMGKR